MKNKCEACKDSLIQAVLKVIGDKPYKLCMNCLSDLDDLNLTEEQFDNLIKSGHKKDEFLLHSDFYEDGEALQPR